MVDIIKTLSGLVKTKRVQKSSEPEEKKKTKQVKKQEPPKKQAPVSKQPPAVLSEEELQSLRQQAQAQARSRAEAQAKEILIEAKDEAHRLRREAEDEMRRKTDELDRQQKELSDRENRIRSWEEDVSALKTQLTESRDEAVEKLEQITKMTRDEAKAEIIRQVQHGIQSQIALEIRESEERAREEADNKAKEILVDAMKHGATDYVSEYTVSIVKIKDEDMKGRIIGKEGRNIRAFESATGVDVDLDEEGVIRLSSFDPVRREIARVALERLLKDGRVQPGRIEELVQHVRRDVERIMFEEGQKLCHAVGVYNLPTPLVALLGRFKYRFSYGQNMIAHTLEETKIGIALAQELGVDVNVVRLGCLLHDIGKVVNDKEGNHVQLGVELLRKYNIPENVVDCVEQHHEDIPFTSIESMLVYISDAISGSRPGARYENYDEYIKRMKDLEEIAKSNDGVTEAFAFQAGRELRVAVDPGTLSDDQATILAKTIKEEVAKKVVVPGSVKITVIRELRATATVK